MANSGANKAKRIAGWTIGILLLLLVLLPLSLYIPWVQNVVKDYACRWASRETGMDISVGRILVKFPLDVSLDDVLIVEQNGDTMLRAGNLTADVAFGPLLRKQVHISEAELTEARYKLSTADSSLHLAVDVDGCVVKGGVVDLARNRVDVADGALHGGNVTLNYLPYKKEHDPDTTSAAPWRITARHLTLDDVDYAMQMQPTIDGMTAHVGHAELGDGLVDTGAHSVVARYLHVDSSRVDYEYPSEVFARDYAARHPVPPDTIHHPNDTVPWTVRADSLRLSNSSARYALKGAKPARPNAFDPKVIEVDGINVAVDEFSTRGADVRGHVRELAARERSGLQVHSGSGDVDWNEQGVDLHGMKVKTMLSDLALDAHVDRAMLEGKPQGKLRLTTNSKVALQEVEKLLPEYAPLLKDIPKNSPVTVTGDVRGNASRVDIGTLTATMPRYAKATVSGSIVNPMDNKRRSGDIAIDARFDNIDFVKPTLMDKATQRQVNLPPMSLKGRAHLAGENISADGMMTLATGKVVGKGSFNSRSQAYDVDATFDHFPVKAVLPMADVKELTGRVRARGDGFDFSRPSTDINADVDLTSITYAGHRYDNLRARLNYNAGNLNGNLLSHNDNCDLNVDFNGIIDGQHYVGDAQGTINDLDLRAFKLYDGKCEGKTRFAGRFDIDLAQKRYNGNVTLTDLDWTVDDNRFVAHETTANFNADDDETHITLDNEDNHLNLDAQVGLEAFVQSMQHVSKLATEQFRERSLNIDTLQHSLPPFQFQAKLGRDGLVQRFLERYDMDFRSAECTMGNDVDNVNADLILTGFTHGSTLIDTLTFHAYELEEYLAFNAHMGNRRGTMDEFAQVDIEGGAIGSTIDFLVTQHNIDKEMGYRLGCNATLTDTAVNMRFFPEQPVIGYKQWTVNNDNILSYNYHTRMIDANLKLAHDESLIQVITDRAPGATSEVMRVDLANVRIQEWTRFVPNMPKMTGVVNADFDLSFDGKNLSGTSLANVKSFTYDGQRIGDFALNTTFGLDPSTSSTRVNSKLLIDGSEVAVALGALNDSTATSPLNVQLNLARFPLRKVSPFIPGNYLRLRGYANGSLSLTGSLDAPLLSGTVTGDSAFLSLPRYGMSLALPSTPINVNNNVIRFDDYRLMGLNNQPVLLNGTFDMQDITSPVIDLTARGRNVQFMNSEQRRLSDLFGKGFANIDASARTRGNTLNINADLTLLAGSNITYVMHDEVSTLKNRVDEKMVTFVNLRDSLNEDNVLRTAAAKSMSTSIVATVDVEQGAKINVFLNDEGSNNAVVDGSGRLRYALDFAGKETVTGSYVIESGNVVYQPPLISKKNFKINSGSSLTWTGDMLNPQLALTGTERVKTGVSNDSGSRLVEFLLTAHVGGTLSNINLTFDMSAENDAEVQGELQSLNSAQLSQSAINMLLYGSYSTTNSMGNFTGVAAGNALYSFLQSQLNAWAAKSLNGIIDLSFGITQFEGTRSGNVETSYSYRLSKSLFDDRFKIVVGGEYSTDAKADEIGLNLISDISLEYSLNRSGSKYLRLFRHTGNESILEGQVTKMGVGFVMKRKIAKLGRMFGYKSPAQIIQDSIEKAEKAQQKAIKDSIAQSEKQRQQAIKDSIKALSSKPTKSPAK